MSTGPRSMWPATMLLLQNRTWGPYRGVGGWVTQGLRKCSDIEGQAKVFGGAAQSHKHACKAQATRPALLSQHWVRWRHLHFCGSSKHNRWKPVDQTQGNWVSCSAQPWWPHWQALSWNSKLFPCSLAHRVHQMGASLPEVWGFSKQANSLFSLSCSHPSWNLTKRKNSQHSITVTI